MSAGGYKGGGSKAASAGGYVGGKAPIANAGGYAGGRAPIGNGGKDAGRRAPTMMANAGGYQGGRDKKPQDYGNLQSQTNTLTSRTMSRTTTQHPDGAISETLSLTETYSFGNTNSPQQVDGFNMMPYAPRREPPQTLDGIEMPNQPEPTPYVSASLFGDGIYDALNQKSAEEELKIKMQAIESQKGSQHKFQIFNPGEFVNKKTRFVDDAEELLPHIEEAYFETAGKKLPTNFSLKLCNSDELKTAYEFFKGQWQKGIQGFCINRKQGTSRIFVLKNELAKVMLTIGHEIGHLQTASLNHIEEEAKAYAFSLEWMKNIREKNIAGLGEVMISECPAENGLHNVAFNFVLKMMRNGTNAMNVFDKLINGLKITS